MFLNRPKILPSTLLALDALMLPLAYAGGPRWVAGTSYFNSSTTGQPVVWKNGVLNYYNDLGDLSTTVTQAQADAMVTEAAA